jgi:hypothetical protein
MHTIVVKLVLHNIQDFSDIQTSSYHRVKLVKTTFEQIHAKFNNIHGPETGAMHHPTLASFPQSYPAPSRISRGASTAPDLAGP